MGTRKIKDAELDGEKVYFASHAKATYMSDGRTVEDAIQGLEEGSSDGGEGAYRKVVHGTDDTTFAITPNTFHVWGEVASLDLSFADGEEGVANEYLFQFSSGTAATTLVLPDSVEWVGKSPAIESGKTYQISIVDNIGLFVGV